MENHFDWNLCLSYLKKGRLRAAMEYLSQFPEHEELYQKCVSLFQQENYLTYDVDSSLQNILLIYQKYYRDAFYLEQSEEDATENLRFRLADLFQTGSAAPLDALEEKAAEAFRTGGFHFLGGRTGGYYGPYIWKTEELRHFAVELPGGVQDYAVKLLDDFVMNSWLDYLTFGMSGTGGWSNGDGLIHCVKRHYDLESEAFRVSLLKHEAQHAADLDRYRGITVPELEYRAKLVELIYSEERNLLPRFAGEMDASRASNGHGAAACRITEGMEDLLGVSQEEFAAVPVEKIQSAARTMFEDSCREVLQKYH